MKNKWKIKVEKLKTWWKTKDRKSERTNERKKIYRYKNRKRRENMELKKGRKRRKERKLENNRDRNREMKIEIENKERD